MEIVLIFIPGHFIMQNDEKLRRGSWMHHRPVFLACHSQGCGSGSKHFLALDLDPKIVGSKLRVGAMKMWIRIHSEIHFLGARIWIQMQIFFPSKLVGPGSGFRVRLTFLKGLKVKIRFLDTLHQPVFLACLSPGIYIRW